MLLVIHSPDQNLTPSRRYPICLRNHVKLNDNRLKHFRLFDSTRSLLQVRPKSSVIRLRRKTLVRGTLSGGSIKLFVLFLRVLTSQSLLVLFQELSLQNQSIFLQALRDFLFKEILSQSVIPLLSEIFDLFSN